MSTQPISTDGTYLRPTSGLPVDPDTLRKMVDAVVQASQQHAQVRTSIIIPVFNEEQALPLVLKSLCGVVDGTYEVVVIDDGSSDGSAAIASSFPCRLVRHPRNLGKGAALRTGLQAARGQYVVFIDADNTYPVELIPTMVELVEQHDLVRGIRQQGRDNIPLVNRVGNQLFDRAIHALHPIEGGDLLSGMYGGRRDRLLELDLESNGFDIETEICVKAHAHGLNCASLPITYFERVGDKKLKPLRDGLRILYRLVQLTLAYNPLAVFVLPGLLLFGLGLTGVCCELLMPAGLAGSALFAVRPFGLGAIAALGAQLVIFGLAVYSAGMSHGLRGRANQLLDGAVELCTTHTFVLIGLATAAVGAIDLLWLVVLSTPGNQVLNERPVLIVIPGMCLLVGCQMLSAAAFLSALRGLQNRMPHGTSQGTR